jgi:hypothetical protein
VGLLDPAKYDVNAKMRAYRLGVAAWAKAKSIQLNGAGRLDELAQKTIGLIETLMASNLPDGILRPAPISTVAVWDTVGSMGIPGYVKGQRVDVFRFVDTSLSENVENGVHAMALDEQRCDFPVTKWVQRPVGGITQMWFVGAHADIGGGYPPTESRLSDLALKWMSEQLQSLGAAFVDPVAHSPNTSGAEKQPIHAPWTNPPVDHLGCSFRVVDPGEQIHESVRIRWGAESTYRPAALRGVWELTP